MTNLERFVRNLLAQYPDILYGVADANGFLGDFIGMMKTQRKER